jgi:hypothetical protein
MKASARLSARQAARGEYFEVPRSHPGATVFILAGGPSLAGQPIDRIAARPSIAVNLSYSVAPWATYVYAQDGRFVRRHMDILKRRFAGRFITTSRKEAWEGLLLCRKREPSEGLPTKASDVAARRTSLAGAITILGLDGGRAADGRSHHHAAHPWPGKDENFEGQHDDLVPLKDGLQKAGITVTNCSPGSRWRDLWPIMSLRDYLESEAKGMSAESWSREEKRARYLEAYSKERVRIDACAYLPVEMIIEGLGGLRNDTMIDAMARDLACPLKEHAPNWQHGRVLYALAREVARDPAADFTFIDIGTAKGFSALCMLWGLFDSMRAGTVHSFDVVDPFAKVARNSIAELDGLKDLGEFIAPYVPRQHPGSDPRCGVTFHQKPGMLFDEVVPAGRIHLAFVDGKHKLTDVREEARKIAARQERGDFILFDDFQIGGVQAGIGAFMDTPSWQLYRYQTIEVNAERAYRLAERMQ